MVGFLPNLLIIGAAKSGTTSLHAYLDHHPAIAMSGQKELQLFSGTDWETRLDWYRSQFPVRAPVRGESSPSYSMDPILPHVPERARRVIPDARILYVVRDPIERLLAHYVEFVAILREKRSFEQAMLDFDRGSNVYVMTSRYAHQLERWRESFEHSRILVVDQRELLSDRRATLREVFHFLQVDEAFWSPEFDRLHNTRERKLLPSDFGLWVHRRGLYQPWVRAARLFPERMQRWLLAPLGKEILRPQLESSMLSELQALLGEDARRLRQYTGKSFDSWSV